MTSPILARGLGPDGRGALAAILTPLTVADAVAAVGTPLAANYFMAKGADVRQVRRHALVISTVAGLLATAILLSLSPFLLQRYPAMLPVFWTLAPSVLLGGYINAYRGLRSGQQNYLALNANLWVAALSRLCAIVILAVAGTMTPALVASLSIATGLAAGITLRSGRSSDRGATVSFPSFLSYSLRSWFGALSSSVTARLDQLLLITMVSAGSLGNYAVAVTVAELPNAVSLVIQRLLIVRRPEDSQESLLRGVRLALMFNVIASGATAASAAVGVSVLFGDEYKSAAGLLQILVIGTGAWGIGQAVSGVLLAAGRPGTASVADMISAAVTIVGIYPAVSWLGAEGAAIVSAFAYFLAALVKVIVAKRVLECGWLELLVLRRSDVSAIGAHVRKLRRTANG